MDDFADAMNALNEPASPATPATIGGMVRHARERAGLSLRNLEAITGISRTALNRLELDQIDQPDPRYLHRLAEALELNSDDLFALVGYQPSSGLPSLTPYLRSKYRLPPSALAEASQVLRGILARYDQELQHDPPGNNYENTM